MTLSLFLNSSPEIPSSITEVAVRGKLVRGNDVTFIDQLTQRAKDSSLHLDLSAVTQIDAAGITALVALYQASSLCGHQLRVIQPSQHVHELLHLVGLEHLLVAENQICEAAAKRGALVAA